MEYPLKVPESGLVAKYRRTKFQSIESGGSCGAWKARFNGRERNAAGALHGAHSGISIKDREPEPVKHSSDCGFAHADGPGQADDDHAVNTARSSASYSRGAA